MKIMVTVAIALIVRDFDSISSWLKVLIVFNNLKVWRGDIIHQIRWWYLVLLGRTFEPNDSYHYHLFIRSFHHIRLMQGRYLLILTEFFSFLLAYLLRISILSIAISLKCLLPLTCYRKQLYQRKLGIILYVFSWDDHLLWVIAFLNNIVS